MQSHLLSFLEIYFLGLAITLGLMTLLWLFSLRLKNAGIVDIFWGTGFVIAFWFFFALTPQGFLPRRLLLAGLVTLWGLRLSIHIWLRNRGKPEDFRYRKWREETGPAWWWQSLFRVFLLQGVLLWLISAPLLAAQYASAPQRLGVMDFLGAGLWSIGFFFEAVGDYQLTRFRANPENRGRVLDGGVWRYTRHPNYFGDATQWWGYYLIAAAAGGFWTIFSPILMTLFLLRVSGVTLLEKSLRDRPGYREYIETTSPFVPWFPRKK